MSTADQILGARIAAVAGRHASRGKVDDMELAVAELREVAGDRPDLLAELAGISLGLAEGGMPVARTSIPCGGRVGPSSRSR